MSNNPGRYALTTYGDITPHQRSAGRAQRERCREDGYSAGQRLGLKPATKGEKCEIETCTRKPDAAGALYCGEHGRAVVLR